MLRKEETDMAEKQPIGVISIGSNDIHLLVAVSDGVTTFNRQVNQSMLAELVGAVKGGIVPAKALSQALQDLDQLVNTACQAGVTTIIALATEAMREVANGPAFIDLVSCTLGIEAALISGQEEAALDYCWATFPPVPPTPLLVVDSGGGSTQAILGEGQSPAFAQSLPIGAGNMTKQFIKHDPPAKEELEALRDYVAPLVEKLPAPLAPKSAVLMGGSADHLLQFAADPGQHKITRDELHLAIHELHHKPARDIAHDYDCLPERAHLLAAGAIILGLVLAHYGFDEALVRPNGIRGGLVLSYARNGDNWRQHLQLPPVS
jgi:exopolyphosphatase / guanosine-5'-triphosphate,3'-diphosphate pyrophosphatase